MKTNITKSQFRDAFHRAGREGQFSYHALGALYEYLENLDPDYDLDVIELCCEYTEYGDIEEFQADYGESYESIKDIERKTTVIRVDSDAFIIQNF